MGGWLGKARAEERTGCQQAKRPVAEAYRFRIVLASTRASTASSAMSC